MDKKPFRTVRRNSPNNRRGKNAAFVALIVLFGLIAWAATSQGKQVPGLSFSEVIKKANAGQVQKIQVSGNELKVYENRLTSPAKKKAPVFMSRA